MNPRSPMRLSLPVRKTIPRSNIMPVPYRKTPRAAETGCAAYLDVIWLPSVQTFYGALLFMDGKGQPLEFVHNTLPAPPDFLWPETRLRPIAIAALAHSLF